MDKISGLKLSELMLLAKKIKYIKPLIKNEDEWSRDEIYYAALYETLNSKYQIRASEIICGIFSPLKLLFKTTLKNYIKIMLQRNATTHSDEVELSS